MILKLHLYEKGTKIDIIEITAKKANIKIGRGEECAIGIINNSISNGHGRALLAIEDMDLQYALANKIIDEKLSVREIEKLMKHLSKEKPKKKKQVEVKDDFIFHDLEEKMKRIIGTKVMINRKKNGTGKIEIDYYSEDELERIVELLMGIQE